MLIIRLKVWSYFSVKELFILLSGKVFSSQRSSHFLTLQEKENKLTILVAKKGLLKNVSQDEVELSLTLNNNTKTFYLRLNGSDVWVFNQVILNGEYNHPLSLYQKLFKSNPTTIVDAGANVGLVTIFFKAHNPEARILAIEPDKGNFIAASRNIKANSFQHVDILNDALWPTKQSLKIVNDFRDMQEWSLRVEEHKDGTITSITPHDALSHFNDQVDIFKIDIEGGEAKIFDSLNDMSWLKKVKIIALEIHQEFGASERILNVLSTNGFTISHHGELTIGVNTLFSK